MLRQALGNLVRSSPAEKHVRIVLVMEAREFLNTQDKAGHLIAMSCHVFEDMMATFLPPGVLERLLAHLHQHDHSSEFMTLGNAGTPWASSVPSCCVF